LKDDSAKVAIISKYRHPKLYSGGIALVIMIIVFVVFAFSLPHRDNNSSSQPLNPTSQTVNPTSVPDNPGNSGGNEFTDLEIYGAEVAALIAEIAAKPCLVGQIKGSQSKIYQLPTQGFYAATKNNVSCFNSEAEAQAAGFRKAR
jgi:hypothetical protein